MSLLEGDFSAKSLINSVISNNNPDDLKRTIKESAYKPAVKEFKVYPYRYVVVGLYGLALSTTSLLFPVFSPIVNVVSVLYDQEVTIVNLNSLLYLLMHPLFTFPANLFIEKFGVKKSIMFGSFLCICGSWTRLLIDQSFYLVIAGSILCGSGRPFILNVQGKVVATWFFPKDRSLVTSLLSFLITAFTVIGVLFPGLIFGSYQKTNAQSDPNQGKTYMTTLLIVEGAITTLFMVPNLIFQRDKPPSAPSYTCTVKRQSPAEGMKSVITNKDYVILWFIYCIYFGTFNAIGVVSAIIMYSYDIKDPAQNSVISSVPVATGLVSVVIVSILLKKYFKFKLILMIFIAGCIVSIGLMPQILPLGYGAAIGSSLLNGVFIIPAVPLMLELGIELTFPVSEEIGVGLLFAGGQLFGAAIGAGVNLVVSSSDRAKSNIGLYIFTGLFGIALILSFFLHENLKRLRAEKTKNMTSIHLSTNQWNQIKNEFGGDTYTAKDHQGIQTDNSEDK